MLLTLSNRFFSQSVAPVLSLDSLQGFDANQANIKALGEGFYGAKYAEMMNVYKRQFVVNKYDLYAHLVNPTATTGSFSKYSSATTANAPCTNEDFETGTLSGWTASVGANFNSQSYPTMTAAISSGSLISVVSTNINDPYIGTIPASPLGGSHVVKINNDVADLSIVKLSQTFNVTSTNYLFDFAYWAVMEDAGINGTPHTCSETPFMLIKIRDNNGILQGCPTFSIVAPSSGSGGCAGLGPLTWSTVVVGSDQIKTSKNFQ
jgi:hypothetical protein